MSRRTHLDPVRASFHAVVRATVPAAARMDASAWRRLDTIVDEALDHRPAGMRRQLRLFLRVLSALSFLRHGTRFSRLDAEEARLLLEGLQGSPLLLLRRGVWGLRTLAFMGYYGQEEHRRALGYDAALRGWEERHGRAGPWPSREDAGAPEERVLTQLPFLEPKTREANEGLDPGNGGHRG